MIQGDTRTLASNILTNADVIAIANRKEIPVIYGYIEYRDIFGAFYTVSFCQMVNIFWGGNGQITASAPAILESSCERRTEAP
jgi:hypothetical protein